MKTLKVKFALLFIACVFGITSVFAQGGYVEHKIAKGETLYSIAEKYGVTVEEIKKANPKAGNYFYAGMTIQIPNKNSVRNSGVENEIVYSNQEVQTNSPLVNQTKVKRNTSSVRNSSEEIGGIPYISIGYWDYDGFENWGLSGVVSAPNDFGFEFNMRTCFKSLEKGGAGNYNVDLLPNYSFELVNENKTRLFLTASAGPSIRMQNVITGMDGYKLETKERWYLDAYAQIALNAKIGALYLSAGYNLWFLKFKLSSDYKADGFVLKAGICI